MTSRQIIEEIEKLSPAERLEVQSYFSKDANAATNIQYADQEKALAIADRIFAERGELFKKLAE
jgi:hypothetical protein